VDPTASIAAEAVRVMIRHNTAATTERYYARVGQKVPMQEIREALNRREIVTVVE